MYDTSDASGKEDVALSEDETEMPGSPSDRLLMWSTNTLASAIETGCPESRAYFLLFKAMRRKAVPSSSTDTSWPVVIPKSPSPISRSRSTAFADECEDIAADETPKSEWRSFKRTKKRKPNRDINNSTFQNMPPPAASPIGYTRSVIHDGHIGTTPSMLDGASKIDMTIETALTTSTRPCPIRNDALASFLPARFRAIKTSDKGADNELVHEDSLIDGADKSRASDVKETSTVSGDPLGYRSSSSVSRRDNSSIQKQVDPGHRRKNQEWHQEGTPPENNSTMKQLLVDNSRSRTQDATQDYQQSLHQSKDPRLLESARSLENAKYLEFDTEAEPEYYRVVRNGHRNHYIVRRQKTVPQWNSLTSLSGIIYHSVRYKVGDVVHILLQDNADDSYAKIYEIRDLGDGRKVICILWYFTIKDAASCGYTSLKEWPKGKTHMLTNMLQVLMWDTINGMADNNVLNCLASGKILDVCRKTPMILECNVKAVDWINDLLDGCKVADGVMP